MNRAVYKEKDLGEKEFTLGEIEYIRCDFDVIN